MLPEISGPRALSSRSSPLRITQLAKNLSRNSPQNLPFVVLSRCSNFDDLQPELGGFSLEMDDLLFAVLCLIELGSLVHIFHSVAQHAVDEPGEFGGHGLGRHRRPQPTPESAELRPQIAVALP